MEQTPDNKSSRTRRALTIALVIAALAAVVIADRIFIAHVSLASPVDVEVLSGMGLRRVARVMHEQGVITESRALLILGRATGLHRKIVPGRYVFSGDLTLWDVYSKLREGRPIRWQITVSEGDDLDAVRAKLASEGLVNATEFDSLRADAGFMHVMGINAPSIEGYVYPDTYFIDKGTSAPAIIGRMVGRMKRELNSESRLMRAEEMGMSELELLTLASIIEKEAYLEEERELISAVYHNRLRKRMRLQADPTVVYGIKPMSAGITRSDLKRKTPYNTYIIYGLPIGPIANPGIKSIDAALSPADVPYLYFVSNNDGSHVFTSTNAEHQRAVMRYKAGRLAGSKRKPNAQTQ